MKNITYKKIFIISLLILMCSKIYPSNNNKQYNEIKELELPNAGLVYLFAKEAIEKLYIPKNMSSQNGITDDISHYEIFYIPQDIFPYSNNFFRDFKIKSIEDKKNSYPENEKCKQIKFTAIDKKILIENFPNKLSSLLSCHFLVTPTNESVERYKFTLQFNYVFNRWVKIATQNNHPSPAQKIALLIANIKNWNAKEILLSPDKTAIIYTDYLDLSAIYKTDIFPNLEKLVIENFRIDHFNKNAFLFPNNENLKEIIYSSNILPKIKNEYFSQLKNIKIIDLIGNKISEIERNSFGGLKKIQEIKLEYNPLLFHNEYSKIKKFQFFCGLFSLKNYESLYKINCSENSVYNKEYTYNPKDNQIIIQGEQFSNINLNFLTTFFDKKSVKKITIHKAMIDFTKFKIENLSYLSELEELEELEFIDTKIHYLPQNAFQGIKIKRLVLKNNDIQFIHNNAFNLSDGLEELAITNNNLKYINFINHSLKSIKKINLSHNNIEKITNINDLDNITEINLSYNKINSINSHILYRNPKLKRVDLSYNSIKSIPSYSFYFINSIKFLNLNNNPIHSIDSYAFYNLHNLTELLLHNTNLDSLEKEVFSETFLPKLIILNLKNSYFNKSYDLSSAFGNKCRKNVSFETFYFTCKQLK